MRAVKLSRAVWGLALLCLWSGLSFGQDVVRASYHDWITAKGYDLKFGKERPFAPSNATTYNGQFIDRAKFIAGARCATCHTDTHAAWLQSAHRNSFREPFYQKNVKDLIGQRGIEFTRHCESCHNPAALFSGVLTKNPAFKERPFDEDGVSCISCHAIQSVSGRGIGGYVMGEPAMLEKEDGTRLLNVTDQEILNDIPAHKRAVMRPVLKDSMFCAACHKSQVPRELNDYKFLRAFSVGDEWQQSSFSKEVPHPFYVRDKQTCNDCHMLKVPAPLFDAAAKEGKITEHRWAAANTAIPYFYNFKEQLEAVTKFLENDKLAVDIFALRRTPASGGDEQTLMPLNRSSFTLAAGDSLTADVVITNKNIGHSFPPELRDFYEAFVEFTVTDASGKIWYQSGFIKPNGYLDEAAHNYKTYLVMADGKFNDKHHIWRTKTVAQNNQIQSGRSDVARYRFRVPTQLKGAMFLQAKLQYRRFTRVFSDYALGKSVNYPIVTVASSARQALNLGANTPATIEPEALTKERTFPAFPDWRRWNNYGIALFDQRQFADAANVFAKVGELDEKYRAFALTNRALALAEIDEWEAAKEYVDAALKIDPKNMRATFQRGRIAMVQSRLDDAQNDFRIVLEAYPRDRASMQQLGELAKIRGDWKTARTFYERVLAIDPEDLGANYNLMLVYQRLRMKTEAQRQAAIFKDLKDDPAATPVANGFLQRNPNMKGESAQFHVHDLGGKGNIEVLSDVAVSH